MKRAFLLGNTASDIEMKQTPSGKDYGLFAVYVKGAGDEDERYTVEVWGNYAKALCDKIHKGDKVYVEGELHTFKVEDRRYVNIVAQKVLKL